jgi:DNA-binding SARP family transcriptional activator
MPTFGPLLPQDERPADDVDDETALADTHTEEPPPALTPAKVEVAPVQPDDSPVQDPETQIPTDEADTTTSEATTSPDHVDANPAVDETLAEPTDEPAAAQEAPVHPMPLPTPRILVLGPVDLVNAEGKVEPTKRSRLLEYAAYLALTPGATHTAIDNAIWPDRKNEDNLNTRNTATSKLRRWVGTDPLNGDEYLPRLQAGEGYAFHPAVTTDAGDWDHLLDHDPLNAPTERLEGALALVRGIPFEGTHRKRYAWAESIRQRLISEIVDASYELGRRRLMEGRWRGAEEAVVVGLRIEPAQENLWRLRILAAHESRNPAAEAEAIERLLTITEQLECDLEPETEQLLAALKTPGTDFDKLMANAL